MNGYSSGKEGHREALTREEGWAVKLVCQEWGKMWVVSQSSGARSNEERGEGGTYGKNRGHQCNGAALLQDMNFYNSIDRTRAWAVCHGFETFDGHIVTRMESLSWIVTWTKHQCRWSAVPITGFTA
jgi:hypothetical protein